MVDVKSFVTFHTAALQLVNNVLQSGKPNKTNSDPKLTYNLNNCHKHHNPSLQKATKKYHNTPARTTSLLLHLLSSLASNG